MMMAFAPLVLLMLLSLLLTWVSAWLTTVNAKPIRVWREHPWRVFWVFYLLTFAAMLPVGLGLLWVGAFLLTCTAIVAVLSAIHGLRVTWHRSAGTAATVVAAGLGMAMVGAVGRLSSASDWRRFGFEAFVVFMGIGWWVVLAIIADRLVRRFDAKITVSQTSQGGRGGEQ